ncbi:hypothetical protein [Enterococcus rivorum]|nr:hypothetical protein [Enterococcus rivorum]MBP2098894.1 hypothetical protein [Enterococcus rivorum]
MKRRTKVSLEQLLGMEKGRIQLFNKQFYWIARGVAYHQVVLYEQGVPVYQTVGERQTLESLFDRIKFVFSPSGKVIARRIAHEEPLLLGKKEWEDFS